MATKQEAIHRVCNAGFSGRCATAIVNELGPTAVFQGMPERENNHDAVKWVEAHGYDKPSAQKIVEQVGAHVINTAALLSAAKPDPKGGSHSMWDFPLPDEKDALSKAVAAAQSAAK